MYRWGLAVLVALSCSAVAKEQSYSPPRLDSGQPDMQGVWTGNSAQGIPLERPTNLADVKALTVEEAEARRERGTLGSIWGYEREWRDTPEGELFKGEVRNYEFAVCLCGKRRQDTL